MIDAEYIKLQISHYGQKESWPKMVCCPFCQGEVDIEIGRNKVNSVCYYAWCSECGITSPKYIFDDVDAVAKYWNKQELRGVVQQGIEIIERQIVNIRLIEMQRDSALGALSVISKSDWGTISCGDDEDNCGYCEHMAELAEDTIKSLGFTPVDNAETIQR